MRLDVHKLFLNDAIDEIMIKFDECVELRDFSLEIIHGYKHSTRIKDYLHSNGFMKEVARNGNVIVSKNIADGGVTIFQVKSSKEISNIPKSPSSSITNGNKMPVVYCLKCGKTLILLKEFNWYKYPKCGKLIKR